MTVVSVPKVLRDKLSDAGADALVGLIDRVEDRSQKVIMEIAEERFEKRVAQTESKLETRIAQVESKLETKIAEVKSSLETKIAEVKTEVARGEARLIRWMFIFWVGQVGTMTAIMFTFFRPHS